jgi:O-antigen/teichoic acid export membrane protein
MSRVQKTIKNAKIGVFFYCIMLFAHFFSRKIFLDGLGDEFIGLTSTIFSILGLLNLAELGIGTVIGVTLYKPLFNKNENEINNIINLIGYLYKKIGIGILLSGIVVSLFLPIIFMDISINIGVVFFVFLTFLTSSLLGYFINYHLVILNADQKTYIDSSIYQSLTIAKLIIQCLIVYYYQAYIFWILLELIFPILYSIIIRHRIKKEYPFLKLDYKQRDSIIKDYPHVIKLIKQTFVHKISGFVVGGTDQLLIFFLVNIESVAFFGNYQMIFQKLIQLINHFFGGVDAGIGNLVAENKEETIKKVFWEMMALRFFIGSFICVNLYFLTEPFIRLWLGERYILEKWILLLMALNLFISQIRTPIENFKNAYALFWDTWAPICEALINLSMSIIFGIILGIKGILFGTLISSVLIVMIWKPYFVYKHGFKKNILEYWLGFTKLAFVTFISILFVQFSTNLVVNFNDVYSFYDWILASLKMCLLILIVFIPIFSTIKGFRDVLKRLNSITLKKFR